MDTAKIVCPHCHLEERQVRAGMSGDSQRYKCGSCRRRYIPDPLPRGYEDSVREEARRLRTNGVAAQEVAQRLHVSVRTVANWLRLPPVAESAPEPEARAADIEPSIPAGHSKWRRSTIHDVAKQAGVSTSTISNYLNQRGRMSDATRDRVESAIESLNFTPSALTRALRHHRTHILGVYMGGLIVADQFQTESVTLPLLAGLNLGAGDGEYNLLHFTGYERHARLTSGQRFLDGHIDGLIWVAPPMNSPALERLAAAGLPVVALLSRHVPENVGYVNADNIGAVCDFVAHLSALGHRRIAYLGTLHDSNHWDRREGYRRGLAEAGLAWDAGLEDLLENAGDWSAETFDAMADFDRALDDWLSHSNPPTAFLLPDDGMALSLGRRLLRRGLRIPEDVMIAGFNDSVNAATSLGGLTTVRQPLRLMGERAAECLVALIGGTPASECRLTVPTQLIFRASTHRAGDGQAATPV